MAQRAIVIEVVRDMVRISCIAEIAGMAGVAFCTGVGITGRVARGALEADMRSGKNERGAAVVEIRGRPRGSGVAGGAIVIEVVAHVVRICDTIEVSGMTRVTRGAGVGVAGRMALKTVETGMRAGEGKAGRIMIEC